ncbi:MAG: tRNA 2-thiouridine(34) synthase MnmA [Gemmatimonadetes bacterium]|nr:tRNA 2-thiouridine(34) synthase MnmA [Gemmatimonadota bacterium]MYB70053.1 tRNA 2-thiouridine(34) synthase MnmA [Gemmatimonadota bacterium]
MNVAVLLSGGVDSSLALALLQREKRLALKAYYLKIWLEDELFSLGDCPWETDLTYARATCEQLGVPLEVVPLQSEYRDHIVECALAELRLGRTPSPDIWCNQRVKFGAFYQRVADECEQIASGHYARVEETAGGYQLRRAADPVKDQTYFLSNLSQAQLARLCLPIGHLPKHQVRALAAEFDLPTKDRPDSQGMCFLGKINYRDFVRFHLGELRGDIVEQASGQKKGEHPGYWFYTIGQRHGLQLGGGPWYVTDKDVANNIVYIAHGSAPTRAGRRELIAEHIHWIAGAPEHDALHVKLRHGPALVPCQVQMLAPDRAHVALSTPDPGIAPGQHAVFYDGEICLGGGVIA